MDRPRAGDSLPARVRGGTLKAPGYLALVAAAGAACSIFTADFDRIVALQVDPQSRSVFVGDTIQLSAQAVTAAGDLVADADVFWAIIDVDSGQVGFTLDSLSGLVTGQHPGSGRVQARVNEIRSNPITVTVVEPAAAASSAPPRPVVAPSRRVASVTGEATQP
jgi:hypothetical protein